MTLVEQQDSTQQPYIDRSILIKGDNVRREMETTIGDININIASINAKDITAKEKQIILSARTSYAKWGGNGLLEKVFEDEKDGFDNDNYDTTHYIARVTEKSKTSISGEEIGDREKILTMRLVHINNQYAPLPDDYTFWLLQNKLSGQEERLEDFIKSNPELFNSNFGYLPYPATISRLGTMEGINVRNSVNSKFYTPLGFAMIQKLVGLDCRSEYIGAQLRPELKHNSLSFEDKEGHIIELGFTPTIETLGLSKDYSIHLDNKNPDVVSLKTHFPGYWLDESLFRNFIFEVRNKGILTNDIFLSALTKLYNSDFKKIKSEKLQTSLKKLVDTYSIDEYFDDLLVLLTEPKFAKYLVPIINNPVGIMNLSEGEFRNQLINRCGDGPYSVLMKRENWVKSAEIMLQAAREKIIL